MTPERWQQVQALFHDALAMPPEARSAFMEQIRASSPELHAEVERLLQADAVAPAFLEATPEQLAEAVAPDEVAPLVVSGHQVGPYRIIHKIGHGGMGTVYLAERTDGFRRRVALKVLRRGMDSDAARRRFRYEQQILATLEHPHIARLYDGGVATDGTLFLAMEYVDGVPIDVYANAQRLDIAARLRLFEAVCEAVQYAHQNLVVHRDLKPSNILVTADGTVKLLDFGIAKLLDDASADLSMPLTQTGQHLLTPKYAAPEQVTGGAITTATDVYQLGVVLYELLTGHHPHQRDGVVPTEVWQAVVEQPPRRPSIVCTPQRGAAGEKPPAEDIPTQRQTSWQRLRKQLQGDLDVICLKALQKEPARRYASAEALLADLRRHQDGLPVWARPAGWGYRARTFVQRHRVGVSAAFLVVLALVSGLTVALWQRQQVMVERDLARLERDKAREVTVFLEGLFKAADPLAVEPERLDTLRVVDLLARGASDAQKGLANQPLVQADILTVIGSVYQNLALYDHAEPLLKQAITLQETTAEHGLADRAQSLQKLGMLYIAQGTYEQAERTLQAALELHAQIDPPLPLLRAETHNGLAAALKAKGAYERAKPEARTAIDLAAAAGGSNHLDMGYYLNTLALLYYDSGDLQEAKPLFEQAKAILTNHLGADHPYLVKTNMNLGLIALGAKDYAGSEALFRDVLAAEEQRLGREHPLSILSMHNLAVALTQQGKFDEAEGLFLEAIAYQRAISGVGHPLVAQRLYGLAELLYAKGDHVAAEPVWREIIVITTATLPPDHEYNAIAIGGLGMCLAEQGRYAEAEPYLLDSFARLQNKPDNPHFTLQQAKEYVAGFYEVWGKPGLAEQFR